MASPSTSTRSNRLRTDFADRPVYQVYRPSAGGAAAFSKKNPPDVAFVVFLSEDANSADENRRARSGRVLRRPSKDFGERAFEEDFGEDAAPDAARVAAAARAVKAAGGGGARARRDGVRARRRGHRRHARRRERVSASASIRVRARVYECEYEYTRRSLYSR